MTIILTLVILILTLLTAPAPAPEQPTEPMTTELAELLDESRWPEITPELSREELQEVMLGELDRIELLQDYIGDELPPGEWVDLELHRRLLRDGDVDGILKAL